jgi:hypothetical protein
VLFEVRGQVVDTGGQQGNLNFRRTGIALGALKIGDDAGFDFGCKCHFKLSFVVKTQPQFDRASAELKYFLPLATEGA